MMMKVKNFLPQLKISSEISNTTSTSCGLSRDDQEMGSSVGSGNGESSFVSLLFRFVSHEMDLNPVRMILAELLGTFILVFCVCGIIASTQLMGGEVGLLEYAATAGLTVVVVIYSIGPISGAHVNPAVTIAFAVFGHFPWSRVPFYVFAQTMGSVLATCVGESIYGVKPSVMATRPLQGCAAAFWVELLATFMIVFLATSLICEAQSVGQFSGLIIGIAIGLAVLITGPVSGGSMNPARSLGPAIMSWNFKDIWIYITAPVIGAMAGVFMFRILRLKHVPSSSTTSSSNASLLSNTP